MTRFVAVAFDLFETLVTEFVPDWRPAPSNAERLGVPQDCFAEIWRSRKDERMTSPVDYRDVLRQICVAADVAIDRRVAETIETLYAERLAAKARPLKQVDDRILHALQRLQADGVRLALISNCSIEEVAAWETSSFASLFDEVAFSYREGVAKPDPVIYRNACSRLGLDPERVAFVGDGGSHELDGARRAGLAPYCARWFLDQWPQAYQDRRTEAVCDYPVLSAPEALVPSLRVGVPGRTA